MERRDAEGAEAAVGRKVWREPSAELNAITEAVIAGAIAVHQALGPGFLENAYEEAMILELTARNVGLRRQVRIPILYRGQSIGESVLDLLVEDVVVVELKAVEELRQVHRAQVLSYLRAGAFEVGLLINFNVARLTDGVRRIVNTR